MQTPLFELSMPVLEIMVRGSVVYWFLFLIFRTLLRRDLGNVGLGDFLFVVIVADASQNAMSGESKSIVDGLLLISVLVGWNLLIDLLSFKSARLRRWLEAPPLVLIKQGVLQTRTMRQQFITKEEILAKLREEGLSSIAEVQSMMLETDGQISVQRAPSHTSSEGQP